MEKVKDWLSPEISERYSARMDFGNKGLEDPSAVTGSATPTTKADEETNQD